MFWIKFEKSLDEKLSEKYLQNVQRNNFTKNVQPIDEIDLVENTQVLKF